MAERWFREDAVSQQLPPLELVRSLQKPRQHQACQMLSLSWTPATCRTPSAGRRPAEVALKRRLLPLVLARVGEVAGFLTLVTAAAGIWGANGTLPGFVSAYHNACQHLKLGTIFALAVSCDCSTRPVRISCLTNIS